MICGVVINEKDSVTNEYFDYFIISAPFLGKVSLKNCN